MRSQIGAARTAIFFAFGIQNSPYVPQPDFGLLQIKCWLLAAQYRYVLITRYLGSILKPLHAPQDRRRFPAPVSGYVRGAQELAEGVAVFAPCRL